MAGRSTLHVATVASASYRLFPLSFSLLFSAITASLSLPPASAEIRIVTSQGEHRMGDRDTREDAVRLATEAAKRDALEQVATYLESVTIVEDMDVTRDEIRTYTAGLVLVLDQQTNLMLDGDAVVIKVDLTAQVDTDEVAQAVAVLRENEDARHQLMALKMEIDSLHQELETVNQTLAQASTIDQVQQASQQRQELLGRVQSNAMVSQAWTDWVLVGPVAYPYGWVGGVGGAQTLALLNAARSLSPNSPHVQTAQQVIAARQSPDSSMHPSSLSSPSMVPQPQNQMAPRTLNEINHSQPTAPTHIGNEPAATQHVPPLPVSRTLTDVRQLNPFLPVPNGAPPTVQQSVPPGSRSARALQQFLQPPQAAAGSPSAAQQVPQPGSGSVRSLRQFLQPPQTAAAVSPNLQPPAGRRLPPILNQPQQLPRLPSRIAPRGFGGAGGMGGGRGGGGRGGGGGGRGGGGRGR